MRRTSNLFKYGISFLTLVSTSLYASGYRLEFQSPSVLADGGDAAVVEDAGTNWYNSAGLVDLPQQFTGSVIGLYQKTTFTGSSFAPSPVGSNFFGTGRATSYGKIGLPAFHYNHPFLTNFAFGFSLVPSWGLMQDYGDNSIVRYDLVRVYTRTLDLAPSLAMRINQHFSIGIGPDFGYFTIQERNHARTEGPFPFGTASDSLTRLVASNWGYGAHAGILYKFNEATRFGLNYRSKIPMNLKGYSSFTLAGVGVFETNQFSVNLPQPPTSSLSFYHDFNQQWSLMGTIAYDQWNVIRGLSGHNFMLPTGQTTLIYLPLEFHNTFDFALGTHYRINPTWLLRGSVKYLQTPTNDRFRDINFPDGEKLGFNFGARYQMAKNVALDFIYAHVFSRTKPMNITAPNTFVNTVGHLDSSIDLAGAQIVWDV